MTPTVRAETRGPLGLLTLDRPRALNALDLDMVRALQRHLDVWKADATVKAVVVRGAGERAFCAGGDVRAVAQSLGTPQDVGPERLATAFFRDEYALNRTLHHFPKPCVSLVDGVCMGGGLGVSIHGSHRVVGERLVLAMPETALGFFPDVGGGWFLPRFPGEAGTYLGLTGARAGAADALWLGYATHHAPAGSFDALTQALAEADWGAGAPRAVVDAVLARFHRDAGPSPLAAQREAIDRCFAGERVEDILEALEREGTPWAQETHATLLRMSPTSLKATLRLLRRGRALPYDAVVELELRLSQTLGARPDFREGVRAVLVDKDGQARWSPAELADVDDATVEALFV